MTHCHRIFLRAMLWCALGVSPAWAGSPATAPVVREIVNVFPAQSWARLGAASAPVADTAPPAHESEPPAPPPAPPPPPFEMVGQWWDETGRVVALEGQGKTYLLCDSACRVREAIRPGDRIAPGYRLKALRKQAVTIVADDGKVLELPLMELKS